LEEVDCIHCAQIKAQKNTHASCWHIDLQNDIRSLRALNLTRVGFLRRPRARHGHTSWPTRARKFLFAATRAAPGFHEGVGELICSPRVRCRIAIARLYHSRFNADKTGSVWRRSSTVQFRHLLSCGVMPHWEADVYARNLPLINGKRALVEIRLGFSGHRTAVAARRSFVMPHRRTSTIPRYYYNLALRPV